jgi:hypothetical protein
LPPQRRESRFLRLLHDPAHRREPNVDGRQRQVFEAGPVLLEERPGERAAGSEPEDRIESGGVTKCVADLVDQGANYSSSCAAFSGAGDNSEM